jgi:hypothetical protein
MAENIRESIDSLIGTDIQDFASSLAGSLINAFMKGEDALESFNESFDKMIQHIIQKLIIEAVITGALGPTLEKIQKLAEDYNKPGHWEKIPLNQLDPSMYNDIATGKIEHPMRWIPGMSNEEFARKLAEIEDEYSGKGESLVSTIGEILSSFGLSIDGTENALNNSLASQVKGVTEATASIISGYLNAIRLNQTTYLGYVIEQISILNAVKYNTGYIIDIYNHLTSSKAVRYEYSGVSERYEGYSII